MSDLYSILNNLTDDDIRLQLAFFDSVTIGNAAKVHVSYPDLQIWRIHLQRYSAVS